MLRPITYIHQAAHWQIRLGSMGPFLLQKVGDSNSKHGPWNPEKLIRVLAVPTFIKIYDKKEGFLTKDSRKKAIGKYHRTIPYYNLIHVTCEPFRFSYSVARMNADCSNKFIY